ncbi:putative membrane protein YjcC [compost metagenome]
MAAEALMRWPDGQTPPDLLAEIAEAGGFSNEITAFVMETVLVDMAEPFAAGTDFRVTVNVSPGELLDGSLLATLKHHWPARLPQKHVGFELTERSTASLSDLKEMIAFLRAAGHPVYIDDFGTGYSSLAQVHDLSVDFIKIDRSFLHKLNHSASILPEILAIARRLDVGLVIEGIETEEQAHYFESIDASRTLAQGWLFGRPMSAKDLLAATSQVAISVA